MPSLREALDAGYDKLAERIESDIPDAPAEAEPVAAPEPVEAEGPEATETTEAPSGRSRDESGRFAKTDDPKPAKPQVKSRTATTASEVLGQSKTTAAPVAAQASTTAAPVAAATASPKAPQSLKPIARELWGKLPGEFEPLKQDFDRREREHQKILQENAQLRQTSQAGNPYQEALRPYEATIRASGMEPHAYVGNLMQTVHALTYGPAHVKADALATVVAQYGADLLRPDSQDGTSPLDRALAARLQGRPQQQAQPQQQFKDPRVDQLFSALEQRKQEQVQAQEAEANDRLETMAANPEFEFFNDVAASMGDIFDLWRRQGKKQVTDADAKRAYDLACQMNPDVAPIFEQRRAAEAARKALASTERARTAASSVRSQPTAAPAAQPQGRRAVLEQAYDDIARR